MAAPRSRSRAGRRSARIVDSRNYEGPVRRRTVPSSSRLARVSGRAAVDVTYIVSLSAPASTVPGSLTLTDRTQTARFRAQYDSVPWAVRRPVR